MKLKTLVGRDIDLKQDKINDLKMRLRGPVLLPGDAGYDDSRTVWNAMTDRTPAVIARCLGIAETMRLALLKKGGITNCSTISPIDLASTEVCVMPTTMKYNIQIHALDHETLSRLP